MEERRDSSICLEKNNFILNYKSDNLIKISYLSNYQSSIFGGCGALVTLRVLNSGLGRLCLTITQLSAKTSIYETIYQSRVTASECLTRLHWVIMSNLQADVDHTQLWNPQHQRWTPLLPPDPPPRHLLRLWFPTPHSRRSSQ